MSFYYSGYGHAENSGDFDKYWETRQQRKETATHSYIVISTYYKHAECSYMYFYGDDDLREYLVQEVKEYQPRVRDRSDDIRLPVLTEDQLKTIDLHTLCSYASIYGRYQTQYDIGHGIRAIIRVPGKPETIVDDNTGEADQRAILKGRVPRKRKREALDCAYESEESDESEESAADDEPNEKEVRTNLP